MRTLFVIDDKQQLINEQERKFNELFASTDGFRFESLTVKPENLTEQTFKKLINDLRKRIQELLADNERIVLVVDYGFCDNENYTGKKLLNDIRSSFKDNTNKLISILTSRSVACDPSEDYEFLQRKVNEEETQFDQEAFDDNIFEETVPVLMKNNGENEITKSIERMLLSNTMYGNYFGRIFSLLVIEL